MLNPNDSATEQFIEALRLRRERYINQLIAQESDLIRGKIQELSAVLRLILDSPTPAINPEAVHRYSQE